MRHVIDHTTAGRIHNRELSLVGDGVLTSNVGDLVASEVKGSDLARRDDNGFGHVGQKLNGRAVGRGQGGGELRKGHNVTTGLNHGGNGLLTRLDKRAAHPLMAIGRSQRDGRVLNDLDGPCGFAVTNKRGFGKVAAIDIQTDRALASRATGDARLDNADDLTSAFLDRHDNRLVICEATNIECRLRAGPAGVNVGTGADSHVAIVIGQRVRGVRTALERDAFQLEIAVVLNKNLSARAFGGDDTVPERQVATHHQLECVGLGTRRTDRVIGHRVRVPAKVEGELLTPGNLNARSGQILRQLDSTALRLLLVDDRLHRFGHRGVRAVANHDVALSRMRGRRKSYGCGDHHREKR